MTVRHPWRWTVLVAAVVLALGVLHANPRQWDAFIRFFHKAGLMRGPLIASPETFFEGDQLPLAYAIHDGDLAKVEALEKTVDLNRHGLHNFSFLAYAFNQATQDEKNPDSVYFKIMASLVRAGADVDDNAAPRSEDSTPLSSSLQAISPNYLRALLDGGMSPDYMDEQDPILFQVAHDPLLASVKLLVARGVNVNARDVLGKTAVFNALSTGQLDVVNYLLDHGADPNVVDHLGFRFTYDLSQAIDEQTGDDPYHFRPRMIAIRDRLIKQGVKWPPDPPAVERDRMRARGETPVIPDGLAR
jgi:ankyrin repeat protein